MEPIKVIFLDIDGVLNYYGMPDNRLYLLDERAVSLLNKIIKETGAKIVISSTWRILNSLAMIKSLLMEKGFEGDIIDATPSLSHKGRIRGEEIKAWLKEHQGVTDFVILDDDDDMGSLFPMLVKTDGKEGLRQRDVELAISLLNEGVSETALKRIQELAAKKFEIAKQDRVKALEPWVERVLIAIDEEFAGALVTDESYITDFCNAAWHFEQSEFEQDERDARINKYCEELGLKLGVVVARGDTVVGVAKRLRDKDLAKPD